jgi:hypothetical protein
MANAQFYGVWQLIFPDVNPLLGGLTGVMGVLVLLPVAVWALNMSMKMTKTKKVSECISH